MRVANGLFWVSEPSFTPTNVCFTCLRSKFPVLTLVVICVAGQHKSLVKVYVPHSGFEASIYLKYHFHISITLPPLGQTVWAPGRTRLPQMEISSAVRFASFVRLKLLLESGDWTNTSQLSRPGLELSAGKAR